MGMDQAVADPNEEAKLVRRARLGDQQAFARLYACHAPAVYALALRVTGDRTTAEDVTQESFLRMLKFLGGLRPGKPLRPWLKQVAANAAIDHLRRNRRQQQLDDEADCPDAGTPAESASELSGLLRRLEPPARAVVWLHLMEGWSHRELGERFGHSESWSKSLLSRALQLLHSELEVKAP